jgi:hypothetical protein
VKLLLVQALRSGNILSLDDALTQASLRNDRTIQWLYPKRPVIPQLKTSSAFINWDVPGSVEQVSKSLQSLGLIAGVLANITSHDLRRGAFRDLANLKPSSDVPVGAATRAVAKIGGHSSASFLGGTTDKYVGEVEQETYTARAEQMFLSRKAPAIGNVHKKIRLKEGEITTYCEENNMDPLSRIERNRASASIHRKRKIGWMETEKNGSSSTSQIFVSAPPNASRSSVASSEKRGEATDSNDGKSSSSFS